MQVDSVSKQMSIFVYIKTGHPSAGGGPVGSCSLNWWGLARSVGGEILVAILEQFWSNSADVPAVGVLGLTSDPNIPKNGGGD
jgi:hypothetical protein